MSNIPSDDYDERFDEIEMEMNKEFEDLGGDVSREETEIMEEG